MSDVEPWVHASLVVLTTDCIEFLSHGNTVGIILPREIRILFVFASIFLSHNLSSQCLQTRGISHLEFSLSTFTISYPTSFLYFSFISWDKNSFTLLFFFLIPTHLPCLYFLHGIRVSLIYPYFLISCCPLCTFLCYFAYPMWSQLSPFISTR